MDDRAFVFLDSNILLHFRPPNEIDWRKLCGVKRVDLVIYPRLRTEISNHKDLHPQKPLRARAAARETQLRRWLAKTGEPIRPNVFIHRDAWEPRELLAELGLDRQVHDDTIIAHAVAYQRRGDTVFVATADGGLEMKLEDRGIPVILLPDEMRLAPESDPERQRADRAEAELKAMRNRLPTFDMSITPALVLARQGGYGDVDEYVRRSLEATQEGYERYQRERHRGRNPTWFDSIFDTRSQQYVDAATVFLRSQHHWLSKVEGAMWGQLVLRNIGNQTATGVRLQLTFPDGVTPFGDGGFGSFPQRPNLPAAFEALPVNRTGYDVQMTFAVGNTGNGHPRVDRSKRTVAIAWDKVPQHGEVLSGRVWATAGREVSLGESAAQVCIICEEIGGPREMYIPLTIVERSPTDADADG